MAQDELRDEIKVEENTNEQGNIDQSSKYVATEMNSSRVLNKGVNADT